jgi:hypothetical protein
MWMVSMKSAQTVINIFGALLAGLLFADIVSGDNFLGVLETPISLAIALVPVSNLFIGNKKV